MSDYKEFDPKLHEESDFKAKALATHFLTQLKSPNLKITKPLSYQQEAYKDWDFFLFDEDKQKEVYVEVECKKVWKKSGEWQGWPTIDIPYRKKDSKADIFIMTNYYFDTILVTPMHNILNAKVVEKDTIYTRQEEFFSVSVAKFRLFYLECNRWLEGSISF